MKEDQTIKYGALENKSWSRSAKVLSKVILSDGKNEQCDAFYYYTNYESKTFRGYINHIYCIDYYVFLGITEIQGSDGTCYMYSYVPSMSNKIGEAETYNLKVNNKTIYEYNNNNGNYKYSDVTYMPMAYNSKYNRVTEKYVNNKTEISEYGNTFQKCSIYETINDTDYLKTSETITYVENYEHIPKSKESVVYNRNGNYVTTKHEYIYNDHDQLLSDKVYIDGELDNETNYEYENNFLVKTSYTRNSTLQYSIHTTRGAHGIILSEYIQDANNNISAFKSYNYDGKYRITSMNTRRNGNSSYEYNETYEYSNDICLPSAILNKNISTILSKTEFKYDYDNGNILTKKDGCGNTTNYTYDARGNLISELSADGTTVDIDYNGDCLNGHSAYYTLQPVGVHYDSGYINTYEYSYTGAVKKISEGTFNSNDRTVLRTIEYDIYGNLISDTDANGNTTTVENDIFGRQTSVKYAQDENALRVYYYDVFFDGNEKCAAVVTVDQTNKSKIEYYDLLGRNYKNAVIKNMSSLISVDWENIIQLPSNAQLVVYQTNTFDDMDRIIKTLDGENRPVTYEYDILGNITKQVTGNSNDTQLEVEYTYDAIGNVTTMNQAGHITTNEYDRAGRLIKTTDPMGFTEAFQYDKSGNIIEAVDKNGDTCYNPSLPLKNEKSPLCYTKKRDNSGLFGSVVRFDFFENYVPTLGSAEKVV